VADPKIVSVEAGVLWGERPRAAGSNAHMQPLGGRVRVPVSRVTLDDGSSGWGLSRVEEGVARGLVGATLGDAYDGSAGVPVRFRPIEYAIWDLVGRRAGQPVYALAAGILGRPRPADGSRVRCYDTSLYIDDLDSPDEESAAALIAEEAMQGWERGHRNFKIKIGRGNVHFRTDDGLRRDVAVVNAVRAAVGPDSQVMADANNGYTFNVARDFLRGTADSRVFWLEEAFHEDAALYRELKEWMAREGLATLIADGEGQASPTLLDWAREGVVDVVQYDYLSYGCTRWLATGKLLDSWGRRAAPHHYGGHYGNYVSGHLAGAIQGFTFVEWDEASTPGLDGSAYAVHEGQVSLPDAPGFGLHLDDAVFARAVAADGYRLEA
jgi:L-alanine-DL-glutamate epimerase-like enolase superfamily enzyme